jgi:hypothetical protein
MAAGVVSFIAHYLTLYSCYASIIAYLARFFCLSPLIDPQAGATTFQSIAATPARLLLTLIARADDVSFYRPSYFMLFVNLLLDWRSSLNP